MNDDFRTRGFLPVVIPLAIMVVVVAAIGFFAWLLLYNTREGAAALAIVGAAGVLVAIALAASQDDMGRGKLVGATLAIVGPLAIGIAIATGAFDIPAEDLNVNAEPHGPAFLLADVPPDAPMLAAVDLSSFCLPTGGGCEPTQEWSLESPEDTSRFTYAFDNLDTTAEHNLAIFALPDEGDFGASVDSLGTEPLTPEIPAPFIGEEIRAYEFGWPAVEGDEPAEAGGAGQQPEQFYFVCTVHPSTMYGVGSFTG